MDPNRAPIRYLQKLIYLIRYIIFDILFSMKEHSVTFRCMYILYSSAWIGKWYTKRQLQRAAEKAPNGHSYKKTFHIGEIAITAVAINEDNYSYIVLCESSGDCVLVDVGDTKPVLDSLIEAPYTPSAILSTHKHWDHCYGNKEALEKFPHLKIYGSKLDRPHCVNKFVKNGEVIEAGRLRFTAILVPGHTRGHIIYRLHVEGGPDCLFTGDFLFVAGIGKMFEGTARLMLRSLLLLDDLPHSTLIFPGHEYSLDNIEFALTLEPSNAALLAMKRLVQDRRAHRLPSVPTTLGDEFAYNPFLRTDKQVLTSALRDLGYEFTKLKYVLSVVATKDEAFLKALNGKVLM
uniref:Metallo-beta-lactamase domain-containing protein n=1 Tax=Parascaris univalens TaxID=6257 RepID=A0A915C3H2_PARUN